MSMNETPQTQSVTLRPSVMQWVVTYLPHIMLSIAGFVYAGMESLPLDNLVLAVSFALALYLLYQLAYLRSIKYHMNGQQLITSFGVFHLERNYMELYRVVDFYEHQSLMQRLCGLKTITVLSTDKSTPELHVFGVRSDIDLVGYLRPLVLAARERMRIHEFANY